MAQHSLDKTGCTLEMYEEKDNSHIKELVTKIITRKAPQRRTRSGIGNERHGVIERERERGTLAINRWDNALLVLQH